MNFYKEILKGRMALKTRKFLPPHSKERRFIMTVESSGHDQLVFTLKEKCRTAIPVLGNVRQKPSGLSADRLKLLVCVASDVAIVSKFASQEAKVFANSVDDVLRLIHSDQRVAAIVAPSFPAEFME